MTATKPALPEHNGDPVDAAKIKLGGLGTGFNGLDVQPIYMDLDEVRYFVVKAKASASPSVERDRKGELYWLNRLTAEDWAPVEKETAERVLSEHNEEVQRRRDEAKGQLRFEEEQAAEEREAADRQAAGSRRNTQLAAVPQPEFSQPAKP